MGDYLSTRFRVSCSINFMQLFAQDTRTHVSSALKEPLMENNSLAQIDRGVKKYTADKIR